MEVSRVWMASIRFDGAGYKIMKNFSQAQELTITFCENGILFVSAAQTYYISKNVMESYTIQNPDSFQMHAQTKGINMNIGGDGFYLFVNGTCVRGIYEYCLSTSAFNVGQPLNAMDWLKKPIDPLLSSTDDKRPIGPTDNIYRMLSFVSTNIRLEMMVEMNKKIALQSIGIAYVSTDNGVILSIDGNISYSSPFGKPAANIRGSVNGARIKHFMDMTDLRKFIIGVIPSVESFGAIWYARAPGIGDYMCILNIL